MEDGLSLQRIVETVLKHPDLLPDLIGSTVEHYKLGWGVVVSAERVTQICILFREEVRTFSIGYFEHPDVFPVVRVTDESVFLTRWLSDQVAETARLEAEEAWAQLKKKYGVGGVEDDVVSPLHIVLGKAERNEHLGDDEYAYLESRKLWPLFAAFARREALHTRKGGGLAKRCSTLRRWGSPALVVKITADVLAAGCSDRQMVLTTRGGALRDLNEPREAVRCGQEALEIEPESSHAHMLLGGACLDLGDVSAGERYFAEAVRLGAKQGEVETHMRTAMKRQLDARDTARYLLTKDPEKYAWAREFLDRDTPVDAWQPTRHG